METNKRPLLSLALKHAKSIATRISRSTPAKLTFGLVVLLLALMLMSSCLPDFKADPRAREGRDASPSDDISPSWAAESEMHSFVMNFQEKIPQLSTRVDKLADSQEAVAGTLDRIDQRLQRIEEHSSREPEPAAPAEAEFEHLPPMRRPYDGRTLPPQEEKGPVRHVYVPAASRGRGTLLYGLFAGLDESTPAILRLDEVLVGPNRTRIPIAGACLVGRGVGDANTETVHITIHKLSYVDPVETRGHELSVSGFVVAEQRSIETPDAVTEREGLPGRYVYRWDKLWPTMVAAGISSAADVFALSRRRVHVGTLGNQTIELRGDEFAAAGLSAVGGAADEFAQIMIERVRELRPAVAVDGGASVRVVFDSGFTIPVPVEAIESLSEGSRDELHSSLYRDR